MSEEIIQHEEFNSTVQHVVNISKEQVRLPAGELPVSGCLSLSAEYETREPEERDTHTRLFPSRVCLVVQQRLHQLDLFTDQ